MQCFIYYAVFTSINFPYKLFLALRFFVARNGGFHRGMKSVTFLHKLLCLAINLYWQSFYLGRLWPVLLNSGVTTGKSTTNINYQTSSLSPALVYIGLLAGWIQEEFVVVKHLLK